MRLCTNVIALSLVVALTAACSRQSASKGAPIDNSSSVEVSNTSVDSTSATRVAGLIVRVLSPVLVAVEGASVAVAIQDGTTFESVMLTNSEGRASFYDVLDRELLYVHVTAPGYSTLHLIKPLRESSSSESRELVVALRSAAAIRVSTVSESKTAIPSHRFTAQFLGDRVGGARDPSRFPPGTQMYQVRITGDDGSALLDDLEPGYWAVAADEWRCFDAASEVIVQASAGEIAAVEVLPRSIDASHYAQCMIPSLATAPTSPLGTIDRFRVEDGGGNPHSFWLHRGGEFFVFGREGEVLQLRLVDEETARTSRSFEVTIGTHSQRVDPMW